MKSDLAETILVGLRKNSDIRIKKFWTNYLRHEIEFIGVGIPKIRNIVNAAVIMCGEPDEKKMITAIQSLMNSKIAEDKLASILLIQEHLNGRINENKIVWLTDSFFKKKLIFDWNTCDWLCVRILTPVIDAGNESNIKTILGWHKKKYLWHARASLVPFTQSVRLKEYLPELREPMSHLIRRGERFSKTSVGWVLREISKFDTMYVRDFLSDHKDHLSAEVTNNALKYTEKSDRLKIKTGLKQLR